MKLNTSPSGRRGPRGAAGEGGKGGTIGDLVFVNGVPDVQVHSTRSPKVLRASESAPALPASEVYSKGMYSGDQVGRPRSEYISDLRRDLEAPHIGRYREI